MKFIFGIRDSIENIYKKHPRIIGYIGRLIIAVACFLIIRANCGYNTLLTNIWFVFAASLFSAVFPARFLFLMIMAYTIVQIFSLSVGVGTVFAIVLVIIYLLYFRLDSRLMYVVLLTPLLAIARLPLLIPLTLAATTSLEGVFVVIFGNLIYYMIRYISLNAAVISGMTGVSEYTKMTFVLNGVFTYVEFLYTVVILVLVYLLVNYLKKINVPRANNVSIAIGCGAYIILTIIAILLFDTMTMQRLITVVLGGLASALVAVFIVSAFIPLDYTRMETYEFEDDEYHYYVRAVPKAVIRKEIVNVKRINARKEGNRNKSRGEGR